MHMVVQVFESAWRSTQTNPITQWHLDWHHHHHQHQFIFVSSHTHNHCWNTCASGYTAEVQYRDQSVSLELWDTSTRALLNEILFGLALWILIWSSQMMHLQCVCVCAHMNLSLSLSNSNHRMIDSTWAGEVRGFLLNVFLARYTLIDRVTHMNRSNHLIDAPSSNIIIIIIEHQHRHHHRTTW